MPKFRRTNGVERREALVSATLRCLQAFGHEGVSVRRISAEAGVSMGLINHYFKGSASLVAAAYESLSMAFLEASERACAEPGATPKEKLRRFFDIYFAPDVVDPGLFRIWLVFWSLMAQSPEMRAVHGVTSRRYRASLEKLLRELRGQAGVPPFRVPAAAIGLTALMDGLWVSISLNPSAFSAADAIERCEDWVAALAAGAFPALLARTVAPSGTTARPRAALH